MDNLTAVVLALLILSLTGVDAMFFNWQASIFLGHEFNKLIDVLKFWR
ncbi:MAG: hypothetical protein QNL16_14690 [Rhodobacterales bacterium]|mgnify:FL=1|jgi:hypothetical protein|nr:hypothetical protein [Pseudomonadota bacterium]MDA1286248.1 hypothetical protein [Pseudomonadota bacterium]NQW13610.1 hypothetical protein [Rhodobacter sp.]